MNFKVGDEVILSKEGKINPHLADIKNASGIIKRRLNDFDQKLGRIFIVGWNKPCWSNHYIWSCQLILKKSKTHNHPLTSIFAEKMPVKKRLTKSRKRG